MKSLYELHLSVLEKMYEAVTVDLCCEVAKHSGALCEKRGGQPKEYKTARDGGGQKMFVFCARCGEEFSRKTGLRIFDLPGTVVNLERLIVEKQEQENERRRRQKQEEDRNSLFAQLASGNGIIEAEKEAGKVVDIRSASK